LTVIFHASALSSYSAKVRLVLCVKGLAFEEREPAKGYRSPEYRAIVPMGTLPALQIGDFVLSESEAINEYLEESFPEPAMLPRDLQLRARLRFLGRFHDLYLEPKVRALFPQVRPAARDNAQVATLRQDIEGRVGQLCAWTAPQPYLLTSFISLADCGPLVTLQLAQQLLAACGQPLALPGNLQGWIEAASLHPAVEQALAPWRAATGAWLTRQTA
jgi:glutathione S-transferase